MVPGTRNLPQRGRKKGTIKLSKRFVAPSEGKEKNLSGEKRRKRT